MTGAMTAIGSISQKALLPYMRQIPGIKCMCLHKNSCASSCL